MPEPAGGVNPDSPVEDSDRSAALLHTFALFKANYDDGRDYLTNFEPYVANVLKDWSGEPVKPQALRDALEDRFAIPPMPINTAELMRTRAMRQGWIRRDSNRDFFPNPRRLDTVEDITTGAKEVLGHVEWLIDRFRIHAREEHDLDWSSSQASGALERFVEEFSFELAVAKRNRGNLATDLPDDHGMTVAHSFVRLAYSSQDEHTLANLEEMVQGSMLANVLYYHQLGSWSEDLSGVTVYLDTAVALRALDITLVPFAAAADEMMAMLRALEVNVRVYEHTVEEMHRILVNVAAALRRGDLIHPRGRAGRRPNREVSDAALVRNWTATDLEDKAASLRSKLRAARIQEVEKPVLSERYDALATQLNAALNQKISYGKDEAIDKDVQSIISTHYFRRDHECRTLAKTPAIFVTSNPKLALVMQEFFEEDLETASIPHVCTDVSITNQLWMRGPFKKRDVPRRLLIAESFAGLSGEGVDWDVHLQTIAQHQVEAGIDAERVKMLVGEMEGRKSLRQAQIGEGEEAEEETERPVDVLSGLGDEEVEAEAGDEHDAVLRQDLERQTDEIAVQGEALADQQEKLSSLENWKLGKEEEEEKKEERRRRYRERASISAAVAPILGGGLLLWRGSIAGALPIALVSSALIALAVSAFAWGHRKSFGWSVVAFIKVGAVLAIPVAIFTLASADDQGNGERQTPHSPPAKHSQKP
jgi:hypothetical protein